jgi:hypothetical protein
MSKQRTVPGEIITAQYHPDLGLVAVLVRTPDGKARSMAIRKEILKFHGRDLASLEKEEVDAEMEKMAEGFRRSKGKRIGCTLYEEQI